MARSGTGETRFFLTMLDLDRAIRGEASAPESIPVGFLAHGITPSPHAATQYVLFEKHGPGCCVVDLARKEVVHTIVPSPGREFYGHGVFSRDGSLLYCTETDVHDQHRGYIAVRDGRDHSLLGDFPSFGRAPHDCMLTDEGRTLVIANGGSRVGADDGPNVAGVEIAAAALRFRHEIPDPRLNAGHLAMTDRGDLAIVSAPRTGLDPERSLGGISLRPAGGELHTLCEPRAVTDALVGETLSVAVHGPSGIVGATTPLGHYVTFWELRTGALVKSLRVPNPRGIALTLGGDAFVVNFGDPPRAALVDALTLAPVGTGANRRGFLSQATGSHITMIAAPAA